MPARPKNTGTWGVNNTIMRVTFQLSAFLLGEFLILHEVLKACMHMTLCQPTLKCELSLFVSK